MTYFDDLDPARVQAAFAKIIEKQPELVDQSNGDAHFALFMAMVNQRVFRVAGVFADDLPDYAYRDLYDSGLTPREVARDLLKENGFQCSN